MKWFENNSPIILLNVITKVGDFWVGRLRPQTFSPSCWIHIGASDIWTAVLERVFLSVSLVSVIWRFEP